jgi:hypothetical protein
MVVVRVAGEELWATVRAWDRLPDVFVFGDQSVTS